MQIFVAFQTLVLNYRTFTTSSFVCILLKSFNCYGNWNSKQTRRDHILASGTHFQTPFCLIFPATTVLILIYFRHKPNGKWTACIKKGRVGWSRRTCCSLVNCKCPNHAEGCCQHAERNQLGNYFCLWLLGQSLFFGGSLSITLIHLTVSGGLHQHWTSIYCI
jgi:hypothetical protein